MIAGTHWEMPHPGRWNLWRQGEVPLLLASVRMYGRFQVTLYKPVAQNAGVYNTAQEGREAAEAHLARAMVVDAAQRLG